MTNKILLSLVFCLLTCKRDMSLERVVLFRLSLVNNAVLIKVKNNTGKKIYLTETNPALLNIKVEMSREDQFVDYSINWASRHINVENDTACLKRFYRFKEHFIDSLVKEHLAKKFGDGRSNVDSLIVRDRYELIVENLLFLDVGQEVVCSMNISNLEEGRYRFFYSKKRNEETIIKWKNINKYVHWKGKIETDTLYIDR